ncbi:Phage tail assembly chaperone [compost metagenome]
MDEWGGAKLIVRALSAEDWAGYRAKVGELRLVALQDMGYESEADAPEDLRVSMDMYPAYAYVLGRCLYQANGQRVFDDDAAQAIAPAYGPVHDRLVEKAFELSGVKSSSGDPVGDAGNA